MKKAKRLTNYAKVMHLENKDLHYHYTFSTDSVAVKKRKRGRPVIHPKVICLETGEVFDTYTEAGCSIGGNRFGVYRCCIGIQKHHHHYHFSFIELRAPKKHSI